MSRNLLKRGYTCLQQDDLRLIDTNELVAKRIEELSLKIGKASNEGFVSGLQTQEVEALPQGENGDETAKGNVIKANAGEAAEQIVADARTEAEALIEDARSRAEELKRQALSDIERESREALEQARTKGYQEGMEKARTENSRLEEEWKQKCRQLEADYQKMVDELEPRFVDTLTSIYEHIFNVELSSYREVITYLIAATIRKIEGGREFMIHVSKDDYPYVSMQKKQVTSSVAAANSSVEIVEDLTLGKNECLIETENGIFDCGLGTQLAELKQKLKLLSYEK